MVFYRESCLNPTLEKTRQGSRKMMFRTVKRGCHQLTCTSTSLATSQNTREDIKNRIPK